MRFVSMRIVDSDEKGVAGEWTTPEPPQKKAKAHKPKPKSKIASEMEDLFILHSKGLLSTQTLYEKLGIEIAEETKKDVEKEKSSDWKPKNSDWFWGASNVSFSSFSGCSGFSGTVGTSPNKAKEKEKPPEPVPEPPPEPPEPMDENLTGFDRWDYIP
jgi:hypothetical protein